MTPIGRMRATRREMPARSSTSMTSATSLYASGASSATPATAERVVPPAVEQRITDSARRGLRIRAVAELPGGQRTSVVAKPGARAMLAARADETDTDRVLLLGAGIGIGILALAILIVGERRGRRGRRARRTRREPTLSA